MVVSIFTSGTGFSDNGVNVIKVVSNGDIMVEDHLVKII
jgi:hypothetical protein